MFLCILSNVCFYVFLGNFLTVCTRLEHFYEWYMALYKYFYIIKEVMGWKGLETPDYMKFSINCQLFKSTEKVLKLSVTYNLNYNWHSYYQSTLFCDWCKNVWPGDWQGPRRCLLCIWWLSSCQHRRIVQHQPTSVRDKTSLWWTAPETRWLPEN